MTETSERFAPKTGRRDFLGLAAIWSAVIAFVGVLLGSIRLPIPAVFPESEAKVKIGPPDAFAKGTATHLSHINVWVIHDEQGMYAMSSICTHLGCIAHRDAESGEFLCPCHGSKFKSDGKVFAGPAPSGLHWLALAFAPDGQIVIDQRTNVKAGTRLKV